jgi:hypothetical protein
MGYAGRMIHESQLVPGLVAGITAIVFGLIPGLAQTFLDGFVRLSDALQVRMFMAPRQSRSGVRIDQSLEFATFGLAIVVLTLLAYLAN